jgi:hypothetical protein
MVLRDDDLMCWQRRLRYDEAAGRSERQRCAVDCRISGALRDTP